MNTFRFCTIACVAVLLGCMTTSQCLADEPPKWDKDSATKELNGMRRYTWALADQLTASMRQSDKLQYPSVHSFLDQSAKARGGIDPNKDPSEWPLLDLDKLLTQNPKFWAAYYEAAPGDPLLMWLHSCYFGINGRVHQAMYAQSLTIRTRAPGPLGNELPRLIVSANRVIQLCQQQVTKGIKHHDAEEYAQAEAIYRDVLAVCPTHAMATYELGYTLNHATRKAGKRDDKVSQPYYDQARKFDPFLVSAYQGSMSPDEFRQMGKLRSVGIPAWQRVIQAPAKNVELEKLESLSTALQESGLHDLALIARQTAVCRRENGYNDADRSFIKQSLSKLLPGEDLTTTMAKLDNKTKRLTIELLTKPK